jgi:hypothetical protein
MSAYDPLSSAGRVLVACLIRQESGQERVHARQLRNASECPAADLRVLSALGFLTKLSPTSRQSDYVLTSAGHQAALQARLAQATDQVSREVQWHADHVVYGVMRSPDAPPLTPVQVRNWIRGYWAQKLAEAPVPADAPPEVQAAFSDISRRLAPHLLPHNPFKSSGDR